MPFPFFALTVKTIFYSSFDLLYNLKFLLDAVPVPNCLTLVIETGKNVGVLVCCHFYRSYISAALSSSYLLLVDFIFHLMNLYFVDSSYILLRRLNQQIDLNSYAHANHACSQRVVYIHLT